MKHFSTLGIQTISIFFSSFDFSSFIVYILLFNLTHTLLFQSIISFIYFIHSICFISFDDLQLLFLTFYFFDSSFFEDFFLSFSYFRFWFLREMKSFMLFCLLALGLLCQGIYISKHSFYPSQFLIIFRFQSFFFLDFFLFFVQTFITILKSFFFKKKLTLLIISLHIHIFYSDSSGFIFQLFSFPFFFFFFFSNLLY